jgi:hypothetical protein
MRNDAYPVHYFHKINELFFNSVEKMQKTQYRISASQSTFSILDVRYAKHIQHRLHIIEKMSNDANAAHSLRTTMQSRVESCEAAFRLLERRLQPLCSTSEGCRRYLVFQRARKNDLCCGSMDDLRLSDRELVVRDREACSNKALEKQIEDWMRLVAELDNAALLQKIAECNQQRVESYQWKAVGPFNATDPTECE